MSSDWCLLLGQEWLRQARAVINYDDLTVRGYTRKGKPFVLRCEKDKKPVAGSDCNDLDVLLVSAVQAKCSDKARYRLLLTYVWHPVSDTTL